MRVFTLYSLRRDAPAAGVLFGSLALSIFLASGRSSAQGNPEPSGFKFNTGQPIQPIFDGWARQADGSYSFYFGYFNKNYVETPSVPLGENNRFTPGPADRGQPTFFYTQTHTGQFHVTVPKDWGPRQQLTWSVTVNGRTLSAVAWLQPEWEIDPIYRGQQNRSEESRRNKAPSLTLDNQRTQVTLPNTLSLSASVQDDGLPKPRDRSSFQAAVGQETPPTLKPDPDQLEVPVNVPSVSGRGRGRGPQGLVVNWVVWRGPSNVEFDPSPVGVENGKAQVKAMFDTPGSYTLRAIANDGELRDEKDMTVTVTGTAGASPER
jgi:hypothetical protein